MAKPTFDSKICDEAETELSMLSNNQESVGTVTESVIKVRDIQNDQFKSFIDLSIMESVSVRVQTQNQEEDIQVVKI